MLRLRFPLFVAGNGPFGGLGFCTRSDALVLDKDAGFLVNGAFGTGSIPASGSGSRMMWYPGDAAFRAGKVSGTEWDDGNVGQHSVAFGKNTMASGERSFAVGENAEATGRKPFAAGLDVTATKVEAVAMGKNADTADNPSVAIGQDADASGSSATAFGSGTRAGAVAALAVNDETIASADGATAIGFGTIAAPTHSLSADQCNSSNLTSDGTLFVVGNGIISSDVCDTKDDAFTVDDNGNATASSHDTFSDRRLKTDIQPIGTDILRKLGEIRPVRYEFKNQKTHPSGKQLGLIAQEVQKEFPSLVSKGEGNYLSLAYPKLTAVLLKGLQEQQSTIEKQRSQIADLQAENDAIKERLAALEAKVSVGGVWHLRGGTMDFGDAGASPSLNEVGTGRVFGGQLTAARILNNPSSVEVAGLGAVLSANANLGDVTVIRGHAVQTAANGNESIRRYYDLSATGTNTGLDATLTHRYEDAELNGHAESELELFKRTNDSWMEKGYDSRDAQANTVTLNGISSFSRWTLGSASNPLLVELAGFEGTRTEDGVQLTWQTAAETGNAGFAVQRATGGAKKSARTWTKVSFVDGAGTTTEAQTYRFTDEDLPYAADTLTYRLRQVDADGSAQVTDPVTVARASSASSSRRRSQTRREAV